MVSVRLLRPPEDNPRTRKGRTCVCAAVVVWMAVAAGCATPSTMRPEESQIFKSKDYIVCRLTAPETPVGLAERFLGDPAKAWMVAESNHRAGFGIGQTVVVPLNWTNRGGIYANGYQTVPILTYHRFAEECDAPLCMPTRVFKEQIRYLKDNGYHAVTPEDLLAFLEYRQPLPRKSVLITIDDGYRSAYEIAYPVLRENGFTAALFIYTELIDVSPIALTWNQLLEMKRHGFSIGSHTMHHSDLTQPKEGESKADFASRVERELVGSKQLIDRKLNQDTWLLAYPYGNYDPKVVAVSKQAGYKMAMSVKRGGNPFFGNPLTLKRDQILERDLSAFAKRMKTFTFISLE